jgi:hypothetical protein
MSTSPSLRPSTSSRALSLWIDPIEPSIAEIRDHQRLVWQHVDIDREVQVGRNVGDIFEYRLSSRSPQQSIVLADETEVVLLVRDRVEPPVRQVKAEMREARLDELSWIEVHDPLNNPTSHGPTLLAATRPPLTLVCA